MCDAGAGLPHEVGFAPVPGEVRISEVLINPSGTDLGREWIEVQSLAHRTLDLSGVTISDGARSASLPPATVLPPGGCLVFGQSADRERNGGAPVVAAYGTTIVFNNDADRVSLCLGPCATGITLDQVSWMALPGIYDGHALVLDADGTRCPAVAAFGVEGSFGTPGTSEGCP